MRRAGRYDTRCSPSTVLSSLIELREVMKIDSWTVQGVCHGVLAGVCARAAYCSISPASSYSL
jgi:hypothetical protein